MTDTISNNHLVVIVDVNHFAWEVLGASFTSVYEELLLFFNSFLLLQRENRLVVIAATAHAR